MVQLASPTHAGLQVPLSIARIHGVDTITTSAHQKGWLLENRGREVSAGGHQHPRPAQWIGRASRDREDIALKNKRCGKGEPGRGELFRKVQLRAGDGGERERWKKAGPKGRVCLLFCFVRSGRPEFRRAGQEDWQRLRDGWSEEGTSNTWRLVTQEAEGEALSEIYRLSAARRPVCAFAAFFVFRFSLASLACFVSAKLPQKAHVPG